ncbi:MAG TPA: hypothetical protein DIU07_09030, partial [Rhodobacteraceae bacterium]|nr:hypothetical protein [Paracoccaceae bacterium]
PAAGGLNIQYAPGPDDTLVENPPRFTWLPVVEDEAAYVLRLSTDPDYRAKMTRMFTDIPLNFFTPDAVIEPGTWFWSYAVWDAETGAPATAWSTSSSFELGADLPATPLPARAARYAGADMAHPRLWLGPKELDAFQQHHASGLAKADAVEKRHFDQRQGTIRGPQQGVSDEGDRRDPGRGRARRPYLYQG